MYNLMNVFFLSSLIYCKVENSLSLSSAVQGVRLDTDCQWGAVQINLVQRGSASMHTRQLPLQMQLLPWGVLIQLQSGSCHNNWRSHSTDIPHWMSFFWLILQVPAVARQPARVACALSLRILDGRWVTNEETLPLTYWGLEAKVRGARAVVSIARRCEKQIDTPRTTT